MDFNSIFILLLETLLMTLISTFLAYLIGLPIGVVLNITSKNGLKPNRVINLILGTFVNILRSIPCLIIVVIFLPVVRTFFGRGSGAWYTMIIPLLKYQNLSGLSLMVLSISGSTFLSAI